MATITTNKRLKGVTYTAQVRLKRAGVVVYSDSRTFDKKGLAREWGLARDAELQQPGMLEKVIHRGVTVGQVLTMYRDDFDGLSKFGRTKLGHINFLINRSDFASLDAISLTSQQLVDHAMRRRKDDGAMASTVNNDFIWLSNAFRAVRIARGVPLSQQVVDDAAFLCRKEGLIGKGRERDRRPTLDELNRLLEYFDTRRKAEIPMIDIVLFAMFSGRRQDEICRIRWDDLDHDKRRVLVRDMKHPRKKINTWCFLPDRAWDIIARQERLDDRIFPWNGKSVSAAFTIACKMLGIKDLRFHDLRHECASYLFELGWDIPRVASVTGHRAWQTLQRYTHLHEQGVTDKYADWRL